MKLFSKKSTLPKGPGFIAAHPCAGKVDIANPAASIEFLAPAAPDYNALQQSQLARANSYATFYKTGEGLFFHESVYAVEGHLAAIEEALTRYADAMDSTYRGALRAEIHEAQQRLARISEKPKTKASRPIPQRF